MNYDEEISQKAFARQCPEICRAFQTINDCYAEAARTYPELSDDGRATVAAAAAIITELYEIEEGMDVVTRQI